MTFRVPVRVLLDDAAAILRQGVQAIAAGDREIDLADVAASDSSLIACILAWRRAAQAAGVPLAVINPSARVRGLASLYGVEQIALD
jgi:phospholipid transport system transporter-binding protein